MNDLEGIAIIGMAGRFPGAKSVDEFWQNLCNGIESISFFSEEELIASGIDPALVKSPNYVKAGGILGDADQFDALFFGMNPREAALLDPQHRLFLECAWQAFETAGYNPDQHQSRVGVFGGQSMNTYLLSNIYSHIAHVASAESLQASIGNDKDSLTTEVAYRLNLTGPAVTIQSSSSTSLVAIHYACLSLLNYECDIALAGGVSVHFPEKAGYMYHEGGTTSPDGHCRAYDAKAKGFVAGHGAGVVALKRLADALDDGDTVHAVIKGSAVNNDGALKVSYMAPTVDGQAEVIALAQAIAGVEPQAVGYVEGHGTGTLVGDPIEVAALTQAFRAGTDQKGFCALGSAKPNIGHLDTAAGVAGLIKASLVLEHKLIPPTLYFETPNPNIDFANSPFYVPTSLTEWKTEEKPRIAGVSSFGMGGTNAHVVLKEPPIVEASGPSRSSQLLLLSAKTDSALAQMTDNLVDHFCLHSELNLADVAYTLQVGRKRFAQRQMLVCHSLDDAVTALSARDPERVFVSVQEPQSRSLVFMFSGQGAQYVNMGRGLYEQEPVFRRHVDACVELLEPHLGLDLRHVLYPEPEREEEAATQLKQTKLTQPALFVIEYALAQMWMEWGVHPQAMIGHSIGEFVAACLAGVMSLKDALATVAARGRLMQGLPSGAMMAVSLSEAALRPLLDERVSLAVINGPSSCVVSGPHQAIDAFQERLEEEGVGYRRLHTSHAFHSAMMEPALPPFRKQMQGVQLNPPTIPYISNVTGTWITAAEATDPDYWVRHLRHTVRFSEGVALLLQDPDAILLEVGPGKTLCTLSRPHMDRNSQQVALASVRHPREPQPDLDFVLNTIGSLWLAGVELDWSAFYARERRYRVPLPTYPFERQRYWIEPKEKPKTRLATADQKLDLAHWFYLPSWKRSLAPKLDGLAEQTSGWLLFVNEGGALDELLVQRLTQLGQEPVLVSRGAGFAQLDERRFVVDPQNPADYDTLLQTLVEADEVPAKVLHLWSLDPVAKERASEPSFEAVQQRGFYSLLFLAQALETRNLSLPSHIVVTTSGAHEVTGAEELTPERATLLGLGRVIPQEYPHLTCKSVDVILPGVDDWRLTRLVDQLLAECASAQTTDPVVAYRGQHRWLQSFERVLLDETGPDHPHLREKGVYVITGGLGHIGFVLAQTLARSVQARLVLVGRTPLPPPETWNEYLTQDDDQDAVGHKIRQLQTLEELGAAVMPVSADVADLKQMQGVIDGALARFGSINGLIHAAGTVDESMFRAIKNTSPADARLHFQTRVQALYVLREVLAEQTLDFCLLTSSLASVLGGLGLSTYAAANNFMDVVAHQQARTSPTPWLSVNWDAWQLTADNYTAVGNPFAELAITAQEGAQVFERILAALPSPQVLVSTSDLQARMDQWVTAKVACEIAQEEKRPQAQALRPNLRTAYAAPRNDLERKIAEAWQNVLGIQKVGIYDNFFELGGNSLVGVQLVAKLTEEWNVQIPAVSLYEGPTIHALAQLITQLKGDGAEKKPDYEASRSRGERRREKRRQRRRKKKEA